MNIYDVLNKLNISYEEVEHPAVFTIKEAQKISLEVINENIKPNYVDFNKIKAGVRDKLGKYLYHETECKPMILIVIQEV